MIGFVRVSAALLMLTSILTAQKPRARELGVPFDGTPGQLNAITDVPGIEVGHATIIQGDSVRTGVTVIRPRGRSVAPSFGGWFSLNGNGEMTGTTWIEESGFVESPIFITNTHSVGVVRDSYIAYQVKQSGNSGGINEWSLPIVAETWDGHLNDINAFAVKPEHVQQALESAKAGPVAEGNTGGGTGMICFGFKGGIGTASRIVPGEGRYQVAALVQCNCGSKRQLRIAGAPVGAEIDLPAVATVPPRLEDRGSIIIVVATDAPLLPHQMKRLARRASMGLARLGATSGNGSGDIFIAFSTANPEAGQAKGLFMVSALANDTLNPIFEATVQAVEEAIVNALVAAEDMTGYQGHTIKALPHDGLRHVLKKYNRLSE